MSLHSCYNDNVEDLYPDTNSCDTTNVTYLNTVWPIIDANCIVCHGGEFPSGNVSLSGYDGISAVALDGRLLGVIRHEPNFPQMPKNSGKLPKCDIEKIATWVNAGAPDN